VSPSGKKNPAASTRDRLLALAREQGVDFQLVLTRYGLERLLYRLSHSPHQDRFVLKGAMLFILWSRNPHRPTRDVDFLGSGDSSEAGLRTVFRDLCDMPDQGDGVTFDPESVRAEPIRDDTEYGGMRVTLTGQLANARIPIQADIGFGDAVTPETVVIEYPTILDDPAPTLRTYPRETVIAEKYQALVALGMANSRMKDFYDLWVMARDFDYQGDTLAQAIGNTFARRRTELPEGTPSGLGPDFAGDRQKNIQWKAFLSRLSTDDGGPTLLDVCEQLAAFLRPPTEAARGGGEFDAYWKKGGPWSETS
jgi:predicted nucleotidyltransferase component of viral defense system